MSHYQERYEETLVKEPEPNRLYRNADKGMLAGVCAGIADYFGFDANIVRVLVVIGTLFFGGPLIPIAYLVLALLLPKDPRPGSREAEQDSIERRVRAEPHATLASVRHRFRELDARLQRIEKYVTSERFKLDREFERLKD